MNKLKAHPYRVLLLAFVLFATVNAITIYFVVHHNNLLAKQLIDTSSSKVKPIKGESTSVSSSPLVLHEGVKAPEASSISTTPTPTRPAAPSGSTASCNMTKQTYGTDYKDDPLLDVGKTRTTQGYGGQTLTCPNMKTTSYPPINQVVYTGTRPVTITTQPVIDPNVAASNAARLERERQAIIQACLARTGGSGSASDLCYALP